MGLKQLYNDNLRKLWNEYRDVPVMPGYYHFKEVCPGELKEISVCLWPVCLWPFTVFNIHVHIRSGKNFIKDYD